MGLIFWLSEADGERAAQRFKHEQKKRKALYKINRLILVMLILTAVVLLIVARINSQKPQKVTNGAVLIAHSCCVQGDNSFNNGRYAEAFQRYSNALTYYPNSFDAYHGMALSAGHMCENGNANCRNTLKIIDKIKRSFPDHNIDDLLELEQSIKKEMLANS